MADPITIIAIGGSVLSAMGAIQQGQAAQQAADFNATIAMQNAQVELARAEAMATRKRREMDKVLGMQRAIAGGSGIDVDSFQDVLDETIMVMEADALNIEYGGIADAQALETSAALDRASGENARMTGLWSGAANLLTGGAAIAAYREGD